MSARFKVGDRVMFPGMSRDALREPGTVKAVHDGCMFEVLPDGAKYSPGCASETPGAGTFHTSVLKRIDPAPRSCGCMLVDREDCEPVLEGRIPHLYCRAARDQHLRVNRLDAGTGQPLPFTDYVYLAGPMTGIEAYNFPAFMAAAAALEAAGLRVWNPATADMVADGFDPVKDVAHTHAHYMLRDLPAVTGSLGVATLPNWHTSKGARLEATVALALDLPVKSVGDWIADTETTNTDSLEG